MTFSLPLLVFIILFIYILALWIYSFTTTYLQRFMFFLIGSIFLTIIYSIVIGSYLGRSFMIDRIAYMQDQLSWEISVIWGGTLFILIKLGADVNKSDRYG